MRKRFDLLEAHLARREFFVDAYAFPMVRWAEATLADGLSAFPNIRAHHQRTVIDSAVQRVLASEA